MKKIFFISLASLFMIAAMGAAIFYYKNLRGAGPALRPPVGDIGNPPAPKPGENETGLPLSIADNFSISIFAKNLPGARVLAFDPAGNLWVSRTKQGAVSVVEIGANGKPERQRDVFTGLKNPHGLAFDPGYPQALYIATETAIFKTDVSFIGNPELEKIIFLPGGGGGHATRTIGFGPDGRLYVSIGSTCNVCREKDERHAAVYSMNKDGSDFRQVAKGLRNSVFFAWNPADRRMWATEMGRDHLGDDLPPDEINIIEEGKNYGWPICYGKNIHDTNFDKNTYIRNPCTAPFETPSHIDLPAHSAPLGLAFVPENDWPDEYRNDLFVAYHGSWNRSVPTGYAIMRLKRSEKGEYMGAEDFIGGWLSGNRSLGRPVDILVRPGGVMYVSDDKAGVIYLVRYTRK